MDATYVKRSWIIIIIILCLAFFSGFWLYITDTEMFFQARDAIFGFLAIIFDGFSQNVVGGKMILLFEQMVNFFSNPLRVISTLLLIVAIACLAMNKSLLRLIFIRKYRGKDKLIRELLNVDDLAYRPLVIALETRLLKNLNKIAAMKIKEMAMIIESDLENLVEREEDLPDADVLKDFLDKLHSEYKSIMKSSAVSLDDEIYFQLRWTAAHYGGEMIQKDEDWEQLFLKRRKEKLRNSLRALQDMCQICTIAAQKIIESNNQAMVQELFEQLELIKGLRLLDMKHLKQAININI